MSRRDLMMGKKTTNDNIIALLHFDDTNNLIYDECGNTWTVTGTFSSNSSGKFSRCLYMYKSSSSTKVDLSAYLKIPANNFTVDFWVKGTNTFSNNQNWRPIVQITDDVAVRIGVCNGSSSSYYNMTCKNNDNLLVSRSTSRWDHMAIEYSFNTEQIKFYYNGVLKKTTSYTFSDLNNIRVVIGEIVSNYTNQANIDELRICKGCVYNGSFTPPTAPYSL